MTVSDADRAAFEREALPLFPDVSRFALSLARNEADADDLVQDTFLTAQRKWRQYAAGTDCRAWLFTICRHRFYRLRQRDERVVAVESPELESLAAGALHTTASQAGLSDLFERSEIIGAVEDAIAELPQAFRDVVLLVDVNDETYESASLTLGVPIGTVRSRLFRARRLLQERLIAHALDAGIVGGRQLVPPGGGQTVEPMPDCQTVMRQLWDYLDGELTDERMAAVRAHVAVCARCQSQEAFERAFLVAVSRARRDHSNPLSLRERVQAALRRQGYEGR